MRSGSGQDRAPSPCRVLSFTDSTLNGSQETIEEARVRMKWARGRVWGLVARHSSGRVANPEELVRFISTPTTGHVFLVVAWMYAGYHSLAY